MLLEKVEVGKKYDIEWKDGDFNTKCVFVMKHRGFFIFLDKNDMKIICRPESIRSVEEVKEET